jgi:HD-GYP domain-containing protein (c-di-GMP phosphodiesterase class II)
MVTGTRDAELDAATYLPLVEEQPSASPGVLAPHAAVPFDKGRPASSGREVGGSRWDLAVLPDPLGTAAVQTALAYCLDVTAALLVPVSASVLSPSRGHIGGQPLPFEGSRAGAYTRPRIATTMDDADMGVLRASLETQALMSAAHGQVAHTLNRYGAALWLPLGQQPGSTPVLCLRRYRSAPFTPLDRDLGHFVAALLSHVLYANNAGRRSQEILTGLQRLLEARLPSFGGLVSAVAFDAERLAHQLSIQAPLRDEVRLAAIVRDVGFVGMPGLTGRRDDDRRHTLLGADRVHTVPALRNTAPLIRHHHERWDGNGYPDGLAGCVIPLGSRIIAVAEAFHLHATADLPVPDNSRRPGPQQRAVAALLALQREAGTLFDPYVVDAFVGLVCDDLGISPHRLLSYEGSSIA